MTHLISARLAVLILLWPLLAQFCAFMVYKKNAGWMKERKKKSKKEKKKDRRKKKIERKKGTKKETRPYTRQHQSRAFGQGQ